MGFEAMTKISLIHATRGRPLKAIATAQAWLEHAEQPDRVEHIFGIQEDDRESADAFTAAAYDYVTTPPPPAWASSSVANWNAAAHASTGEILVVIADDLTPPFGWDAALEPLAELAGPVAAYVPDQIKRDGLMRHPVVNRDFLRRRGHIFDPQYFGVFCDNDFNVWCQVYGVPVVAADKLAFHHDHPLSGADWDKITLLQNTDFAYQYGQSVFNEKWPALVWSKVKRTHSVWIGGPLTVMERLTLALLLKHGHEPTLWVTADWLHRDTVPDGVVVREIYADVLPPVRFAGKPHPSIPNGGIGSYAQWSDYFALLILSENFGDLWIQLDVAATAPIYAAGNTFTTYVGGIQTCCFTMEPNLAALCAMRVRNMLETRMSQLDWHDTMTGVARILRDRRALVTTQPNFKDCGCLPESPYNRPVEPGHEPALIHWSNATHVSSKHEPVPGSLYARLIAENL
jgi:hypothetical protein